MQQSDPPGARHDYISPNFQPVYLDACFPDMVVGDPTNLDWPHLRDGPHIWYCDSRVAGTEFLNRDEVHILYNTTLRFAGKPALEVGCRMGWSTCHMAAGGVSSLDVIDPSLDDAMVRDSVIASLRRTDAPGLIRLRAGGSPDSVQTVGREGQRWSLTFINGNHNFPAPVRDAVVCERYAEADALILFHHLIAPSVAEGLYYLRDRGWNVRLYHTLQIMGAAWRGAASPVDHVPDPAIAWDVPDHLQDLLRGGAGRDGQSR